MTSNRAERQEQRRQNSDTPAVIDRKEIPTQLRLCAESLLGRSLTAEECAEWICVRPRQWRMFEVGERIIHDGQIKLFCFEAGLAVLEDVEHRGAADLDKALGGPASIKRVVDYLDTLFAGFDPVERAFEEREKAGNTR